MNSPIEGFFKLGDKVTKGNIVRKAQYDYYLFWILFIAFFYLMINRFMNFYSSGYTDYYSLGWGFVMLVIVWFNYNGLVGMYNSYQNLKRINEGLKNQNTENKPSQEDLNVESVEKMMKNFEEG